MTIEARTIRKVRIRIIPVIFLLYIVAFLDRINIGFAALAPGATYDRWPRAVRLARAPIRITPDLVVKQPCRPYQPNSSRCSRRISGSER
jgi:hypothetical protein